jgi:hypothetical protein
MEKPTASEAAGTSPGDADPEQSWNEHRPDAEHGQQPEHALPLNSSRELVGLAFRCFAFDL